MAKRKRPTQADDVDESVHHEQPETLDDFLREMHQTTPLEEGGMPSLDKLKEMFKTKSAAIRYLHTLGFKVKDISKHLNVRYQHVRNVLTTELKRGPNEPYLPSDQAVVKVPLLKDPYTPDSELNNGDD